MPNKIMNSDSNHTTGIARQLLGHAAKVDHVTATALLAIAVVWFISRCVSPKTERPDAPILGYRSIFEPTLFLQIRFITGARHIVTAAYNKMKDRPFLIRRHDVDFMVLPIRYLQEIRWIPISKLSSRGAQSGNLAPKYTGMQFVMETSLHLDVLKKKLIPDLYKYVDLAKEELEYAWDLVLPKPEEWVEVPIEKLLRSLVARMTANVFMGHPACRDPEWLDISVGFSIDLFTAAFTLKMFPPWAYWFVVWFIPARYRTRRQVAKASKIVGRLMEAHAVANEKRKQGQHVEEKESLLHWMMDNGTPREVQVEEMASRQCILTLASIHTTASSSSNILFDLCAHPEWFPVLQQEIDEIAKDLGPPGSDPTVSARDWVTRLEKLDSFFVESQRHNPVLLLGPQRLAYEDITLKDGTRIPKGVRLAFANYDYGMDPDVFDNPTEFDPMRSYRELQSTASDAEGYRAGVTHPKNLAFGYGNQACPGRHFAVAEIKLVMSRLLYDYEFKFPEGKSRPKNQYINENVFTDQSATVMMRKRRAN